MALPRIVAMTCKEKVIQHNGDVLVAFWTKPGEDTGIGGYARIIVAAAVAADFVVGTEYTWTATAGD